MSGVTNYENLANAIILQAVRDYRTTLKCLKRNPCNRTFLSLPIVHCADKRGWRAADSLST